MGSFLHSPDMLMAAGFIPSGDSRSFGKCPNLLHLFLDAILLTSNGFVSSFP